MSSNLHELADCSRAWPFEEARKLIKRLSQTNRDMQHASNANAKAVVFETGYGPSGLPHIGTFGEVARTQLVRHAFEVLTGSPTQLIVFSDDMDGLRKVPDNVPNKQMLQQYLQKPLTKVPDPFERDVSFGEHNNNELKRFLDNFNFEYQFYSATQCYGSGIFDEALLKMLEIYDLVMDIMLPSLGKDRRSTYAPFLPICPETGNVLYVPVVERNLQNGTIIYKNASGKSIETSVRGGNCKLQWKPDWGMRWYALGVDYEMCGKDLIDTRNLSSKICKALGGMIPEGLIYEHFLDENGEKISKSKGNGLTIGEWLDYAPKESLELYMYSKPKTAKRLHFDVVPKYMDEYLAHARAYQNQDLEQQLLNPLWHIHKQHVPALTGSLNFSMLLNLASVIHGVDSNILRGFLARYEGPHNKPTEVFFDRMIEYALAYTNNFVAPFRVFPSVDDETRKALETLHHRLESFDENQYLDMQEKAKALQDVVLEVGKSLGFQNLREWYRLLYQQFFGSEQGPRLGSFIALYGVQETCTRILERLDMTTNVSE